MQWCSKMHAHRVLEENAVNQRTLAFHEHQKGRLEGGLALVGKIIAHCRYVHLVRWFGDWKNMCLELSIAKKAENAVQSAQEEGQLAEEEAVRVAEASMSLESGLRLLQRMVRKTETLRMSRGLGAWVLFFRCSRQYIEDCHKQSEKIAEQRADFVLQSQRLARRHQLRSVRRAHRYDAAVSVMT